MDQKEKEFKEFVLEPEGRFTRSAVNFCAAYSDTLTEHIWRGISKLCELYYREGIGHLDQRQKLSDLHPRALHRSITFLIFTTSQGTTKALLDPPVALVSPLCLSCLLPLRSPEHPSSAPAPSHRLSSRLAWTVLVPCLPRRAKLSQAKLAPACPTCEHCDRFRGLEYFIGGRWSRRMIQRS